MAKHLNTTFSTPSDFSAMDVKDTEVECAEQLVARSIAPIRSQYLKPREEHLDDDGPREPKAGEDGPKQAKGSKQSKRAQRKQRRKVWISLMNEPDLCA